MMSDEREIDLFASGANRGSPRGAERVWHDALLQAERTRASKAKVRAVRAGLAVACAAVAIVGVGALRASQGPLVPANSRIVHLAGLPDGWSEVAHSDHKATSNLDPPAHLSVYQSGDSVLIETGFSPNENGIAWAVAEGPDASDATVAGLSGRFSEGGNLNHLSVLTVTRPDGQRARVLGRGLAREDFLAAAAAALGGTAAPAGYHTTYDGSEASGLMASTSAAWSSLTVEIPSGKRITVMAAVGHFDPDSAWWLYPSTSRLNVRGHEALLWAPPNELNLAFQEGSVSVLVNSTTATLEDLRTAAEALRFGDVDGAVGSGDTQPDDAVATTSTTTPKN